MRIHLISKATIEDYMLYQPTSRSLFEGWMGKLKFADWEKPSDIQKSFRSADLLGKGSNRVVFDIGGNNYRMIGMYLFGDQQVHLFVCWIGTHAEYDELCGDSKQYTIANY